MGLRPRRGASPGVGDLDLLPVMNLISLLIPFLLTATSFVSYASLAAAVPQVVAEPSANKDRPVLVVIAADGLRVDASGLGLGALDGSRIPCGEGGCEEGAYDLDSLGKLLGEVKKLRPDAEDVILMPEATVPYEVIISVMDAARERQEADGPHPLFPNLGLGASP